MDNAPVGSRDCAYQDRAQAQAQPHIAAGVRTIGHQLRDVIRDRLTATITLIRGLLIPLAAVRHRALTSRLSAPLLSREFTPLQSSAPSADTYPTSRMNGLNQAADTRRGRFYLAIAVKDADV